MTNKLTIIDPKEYYLDESKALTISNSFQPKIVEIDGYVAVYEYLLTKEISIDVCKEAKELRLKLVKVRTGIDKIHETEKAYYLVAGRYVDALKNKLQARGKQMEEKLEGIEKHFENLEKERLVKLKEERENLLNPYLHELDGMPIVVTMEKDVFDSYLEAKKVSHAKRIEDERLAEIARLEAEKAAKEEQERIRLENEKLKQEAEVREKEIALERQKQEAGKKAFEEKARKEREAIEKKAAEEKAKQDELLRLEREKQAKIEAELRAKQEAEKKAELEKIEAEKQAAKEAAKLAKAPIKKQLLVWVNSFQLPKTDIENVTSKEINDKFEAFKKWSLTQIENL